MNHGPLMLLGAFLSFAFSWAVMIYAPVFQLGGQQSEALDVGGRYPVARSGLAEQGREVYRAQGCQYCHTQQTRAVGYQNVPLELVNTNQPFYTGGDFARGWGKRPSVAQDYLFDKPVMLGSLRLGQDLAGIGARQTNALWHLQHLYNPKSVSPGSMMPQYPYLFEKRRVQGKPSPDALIFPDDAGIETGYEIIPKREARALVAYLLSLDAPTRPIPLAPVPKPKSKGDTNEPPADAAAPPAQTK